MSSIVFKLFVLTVILAVVSASHVERERRESKFARFWKNIGKGIKDAAVKVGGGIKKVAKKVGSGIKKAAVKVGSGIKNVAVDVGDGIEKAAVDAGKGIEKAAVDVGKGIGKVAVDVGKGIKKAATKVGSGIKKAAVTVGKGFSGTFKWMFNIKFIEADTVEEEAEIILTETDTTIHKGNELVIKGELLMKKADEIEQSLGNSVGKRAIGKRDAKGFQAIISAVREAALRAIKAGRTIVGNSEKISAALNDAVKDIRAVIAEGLIDVGGAISDVGDSVSKAGQVLNQAKTAADNIDLGLGDTATELEITGKLSIEAAQSFEEVGRRSVTLAQRIVRLGKNLVEVIKKAAKNIIKAAGIKGKK